MKTIPGRAVATINPASAEPTERDLFIPMEFKLMADCSSTRRTNSGVIAPHAGIIIAVPITRANVKASRIGAVVIPESVNTPRVTAGIIIQTCEAIR